MSLEIGKLVAVFEARTENFDAGAKRVEASMKSAESVVNESLNKIKTGTSSFGVEIERSAQRISGLKDRIKEVSAETASVFKDLRITALTDVLGQATASHKLLQEAQKVTAQNINQTTNAAGGLKQALVDVSRAVQPLGGPAVAQFSAATTAVRSLEGALSALLSPIGLVALGIGSLAVAAGAVYELATSAAAATGRFKDLSQATGFSVETLSALSIAAKTSGGNIETVATSLGIFQRNMESARTKGNELTKVFKDLNIDVVDNEKALRQAFTVLAKMPEGATQTATAMKLFGRSGREVLAIMKDSGTSVDGLIEKFRALGILIDTRTAKAGDELADQMVILNEQFAAVGRQIGVELIPQVLSAAQAFSKFLVDNKTQILGFADLVRDATSSVVDLASNVIKYSPLTLIVRLIAQRVGSEEDWDILRRLKGEQTYTEYAKEYVAAVAARGATTFAAPFQQLGLGTPGTRTPQQLPLPLPGVATSGMFSALREFISPGSSQSATLEAAKAPPPSGAGGGGGGGGGGRGGGPSDADRATKYALQISQIQLRAAEDTYKDVLDKERSFYDQSLISLEQYSQARIQAENTRVNAEREVFAKEQVLISTGSFKSKDERKAKQDDLDQKKQAAELKHGQTMRGITDEKNKAILAAEQRHAAVLITLQETTLQTLSTALRTAVQSGQLSAIEAENKEFDAQATILENRVRDLKTKLAPISPQSLQAGELRDAIAQVNAEIVKNQVEHNQKLAAARIQDVQSAQQYMHAIEEIYTDIASVNRDTLSIQLRAIQDNTLYRTQAIQIEAQVEKAAESERLKTAIQELSQRREMLRVEIANKQEAAQQMEAIDKDAARQMLERAQDQAREITGLDRQIEAEKRNSSARIVEIERQAQERIIQKWREMSRDITGIITAGITGGLKGMADSLRQILDQVSSELLNSAIFKILQPNAPNQGSQAGGLVGALTNKILGAIGLGAAKTGPTVDPALLANSAATTANSTATTGNTFALQALTFANQNLTFAVQTLNSTMVASAAVQGTGGFWESLAHSIIGGALHGVTGGGEIGPPGHGGISPGIDLGPHHGMAAGGSFGPGEWFMAGEKGPEPIYSGSRSGFVIPHDMAFGQGQSQTANLATRTLTVAIESLSGAIAGIARPQITQVTHARGDEAAKATEKLREQLSTVGKDITVTQTQGVQQLNDATGVQTGQIVNTVQTVGSDIVQAVQPKQESFWGGLLKAALGGAITGATSVLAGGLQGGGKGGGSGKGGGGAGGGGYGGGGLAEGGYIKPGEWRMVGERGPEPAYGGPQGMTVFPHEAAGKKENHISITINVPVKSASSYSSPKSRRELADTISEAVQGALR